MGRNISFAVGEFFHLYNRGTEKRDIFIDKADYERFLALLFVANGSIAVDLKLQGRTLYELGNINRGKPQVEIVGYVLMPNHFHLLVREIVEGGTTAFMRKLGTAYTMYFNKKYERSGALFQGKFKAKHVDNDPYLQYVLSYIHLNPVKLIDSKWRENGISNKTRAENFLKNYRYSSFIDYSGTNRVETALLVMDSFPQESATPHDFQSTTFTWLNGQLQGRTL